MKSISWKAIYLLETNPSLRFLTSNCCFRLKYKSSICNTAFSNEKVISSESGEKYVQIERKQFKTTILLGFSLDFWTGLLVDYSDVFISCLGSHSDGTHSLQRIHWWTSYVILNFSKSFLMKKQTHLPSCMAWGWVNLKQIFILVNYFFKVNAARAHTQHPFNSP